ncbi:MAG: DUF503 domain-containing protein [Candidatus Omnitrophica bacterium]|nr:DUF503 domain-containing protein [Candidatus Omnitrophota bacterium]
MTIGILRVLLFIPESNSLKEKRMVLNSLKKRLRNSFNVSVAQIDQEDKWQKAELVIVGVENKKSQLESMLSYVLNFIEGFDKVVLVDYGKELI